jgi:hypothetical protein
MAFTRKIAKPGRQFSVMGSGIRQPPIPVGGDLLQRGRVLVGHMHEMPENHYSIPKHRLECRLIRGFLANIGISGASARSGQASSSHS